MDKTTKWIIGVVAAVVVIWAGYSAIKQAPKSADKMASKGSYKIGVMAPLTGDAAVYGEPANKVYQMAVTEINQAGGVKGKNLELIVEDTKCNGKDSSSAAQKLVNVDKVQVILGDVCSSATLAAVPIVTSNRVALFSAAASSPDLTGKSHFFFRNYPSDASQGAVIAEVAYNKEGFRKVAFLQEQQDYTLGIYKAFRAKFEPLGGQVTKEEYPRDATDFRSQLTKIRSQNPDALFVDSQASPAAERIFKQMSDMPWKPRLLVSDTIIGSADTVAKFKDLLEGAIGAEFGFDSSNSKFQHLIQAYKDKYGTDLPYQNYGQTEYDAVYMIKDAIAQVGYDGQKIADWSRTVKDWQGASGQVTIQADGDRAGGHTPEVIKNGKVEKYSR